uniref:Reverse transcriptase Ty1/copia-type domain-containing protein n=1 Tax=Cannabis sativa TaxID=3483 RepID=A0A803P2A4_CANSA
MNVLDNKWVLRKKYKADGTLERLKACLVAKGFQQTPGVDYFDTFSPVVKSSTLRIMFTLVVTYNWDIQQVDINNAFFNGELNETVYMQQPKGFVNPQYPTHVCKLQKTVYGLKQTPRAWYEKLKSAMVSWGLINFVSYNSLFFSNKNEKLLVILIYVDDMLITGEDTAAVNHLISSQLPVCLKSYGISTINLGLVLKPTKLLTLEGFSDADWACNLDDRKSNTSYYVMFGSTLITCGGQKSKRLLLVLAQNLNTDPCLLLPLK